MRIARVILVLLAITASIALAFILLAQLRASDIDDDYLSLAITLTGTFLGVMVALLANHAYTDWKERKRLGMIYDACERESQEALDDLGEDIQFTATGAKIIGYERLPTLIDSVRDEPALHQFFSPAMHRLIYSHLGTPAFTSLLEAIKIIESDDGRPASDSEQQRSIIEFKCMMFTLFDFQRRFINAEGQYIKGFFTRKQMDKLQETLSKERNEQYEKLKKEMQGNWKLVACDKKGEPTL